MVGDGSEPIHAASNGIRRINDKPDVRQTQESTASNAMPKGKMAHAQVCDSGFDSRRNSFMQHYGASDLDASLLLIPLVGFLPPDDARVRATVDAVQCDRQDRAPQVTGYL
jgi:GH15 family glucan-1,4-alpha-glucosidase